MHSGHVLVDASGAAGAGFKNALPTMNTTNEMITKSTTLPRNAP